ncbi:hypothetical protein [Tychonema sp. LEGE 06208]|nr:hypothetical protein [Tychonema sp. LEGE 06208]MBE9164321.1 hypothetical protein [Tychonema sp. LEGE 06208]
MVEVASRMTGVSVDRPLEKICLFPGRDIVLHQFPQSSLVWKHHRG